MNMTKVLIKILRALPKGYDIRSATMMSEDCFRLEVVDKSGYYFYTYASVIRYANDDKKEYVSFTEFETF